MLFPSTLVASVQTFPSARVSCPHQRGQLLLCHPQVIFSSLAASLTSSGGSSTPLPVSKHGCGGILPLPGLFLARHPG